MENNNKGLFDKIKQAIDLGQPKPSISSSTLSSREDDTYKQELREKYEKIAKSVVKKQVEKQAEKYKTKEQALANSWHSQVAQLQREMEQQKKSMQQNIDEAIKTGKTLGTQQMEIKLQQEINKQTEMMIEQHRLQGKIAELEAQLQKMQQEQEIYDTRMQQEIVSQLQEEFDLKLAEYKNELERNKDEELKNILLIEKQRLMAEAAHENHSLIKRKEHELRESMESTVRQLKEQIRDLEQERINMQRQLAGKLEESLIEERIKIAEQQSKYTKQALEQQKQSLEAKFNSELELKVQEEIRNIKEKYQSEITGLKEKIMQLDRQKLDYEFQMADMANLKTKFDREMAEALEEQEQELHEEFEQVIAEMRQQAAQHFAKQRDMEVSHIIAKYKNRTDEQIREEYATKWQQHLEILKTEIENEKIRLQEEYAEKFDIALSEHIEQIRTEHSAKAQQEAEAAREEEQRKAQAKLAQDKAIFIKDLSDKLNIEKQKEIKEIEKQMREELYREIVRQKERIAEKFAKGQEAALLDQKRRIEAHYRNEIERLKNGMLDVDNEYPSILATKTSNSPAAINSGVISLADRILAKFQGSKEKH